MIYNEENFPTLPESWISLTVDDAVESVGNSNKKLKSKDSLGQGRFPVIDQGQNFVSGYSDDESLVVDASKLDPVILFGDHTRLLKEISQPFVPGADGTKLFRAKKFWDTRFIFQMLRAVQLPDKGYARHYQHLRSSILPLPPLNEQKRIADKLDTLLAAVDSCRARLDKIPTLIKRFRQSVLAAAMAGQLTEDWRGAAETNWNYERAADACAKVQSGGTPKEGFVEDAGFPFLKVYNIVNQKVDFDYRPQFATESAQAGPISKSRTYPGDVLMNIVGPPLGKVAIVPNTFAEWNINQAITLFRPSSKTITEWLYYFLCSGISIADIVHETKGSAGQTNISLTQCRDFLMPVPPMEEQTEIVRRVEALFAIADKLEASLVTARKRVDQLTPAILAQAFRGELVAQDPTDEPASALLARIADTAAPKRALKKAA